MHEWSQLLNQVGEPAFGNFLEELKLYPLLYVKASLTTILNLKMPFVRRHTRSLISLHAQLILLSLLGILAYFMPCTSYIYKSISQSMIT